MISALFSTFLLLGGDGATHAHLHPQNSDLFFELPDLPTLLGAYDQAPLVRLFNDEEVRASVASIWSSLEGQISQGLEVAAQQTGRSPAELLELPGQALRSLEGLHSVSLSVSGALDAVDQYAVLNEQWTEVWEECERLQGALDVRLSDGGELPDSVVTLAGDDEDLALDPWGRAYVVIGDQARVSSLGPLGELEASPVAKRWTEGAGSYELENLLKDGILQNVGATAIFKFTTSEACQALAERMLVLAAEGGVDFDNSQFDLGGVQVDLRQAADVEIDGTSLGRLWMASGETLLAIGFGVSTPTELAQRMTSASSSLATSPTYQSTKTGLTERLTSEGPVSARWFQRDNPGRMFLTFAGVDDENMARWADLMGDPTPMMSENRMVAGRFVDDFWTPHQTPGFFDDVFGVKPADTARLALVPADAIAVSAFSVDWQALYSKLKIVMAKEAPAGSLERLDQQLAELRTTYGIDLEGQLLASLGTSAVGYLQPIGIGVPNCGVILELVDPEAFQSSIQALGGLLSEGSSGTFELTSRAYKKLPVWTIKRTAAPFSDSPVLGRAGPQLDQFFGSPFAPTPSLVVLEDSAILGLTTIHTKRMIKRNLDADSELHALLNLEVPEGAQVISFMDWAGMWMNFYAMGRSALTMLGSNLPFSSSDLPAPEDLEQYFSPTVSWTTQTDQGSWTHKESSFGPEVIGVPLLIAGTGMSMMMPALAQARASNITSPMTQASSSVGYTISAALDSYAIQNGGSYPVSLEELQASPVWLDFAEGNTDRGMLDRWGRPFRYEVDGMNIRLWSMGSNGFDEDGGGDDLVIRTPAQRAEMR